MFKYSKTSKMVLLLAVAFMVVNLVSDSQAQGPVSGGTLRVVVSAEPQGLDPTTNTAAVVDRIFYNNTYEGLVKLDRNGNIVPGLAESWTFSADGLNWTFNLRQGVKFHDGSDFTADDVVFTIERTQTDDESIAIVNPQYYRFISSVVAADDRTVNMTLSEFDSTFLFNLARGDSAILSRNYTGDLNAQPNGTGPFRFVERVPGSRLVLEKFDDYYVETLPYLDGVVFSFIPDPTAAFAALQAGDVDVLARSNVENAPIAAEDPNLTVFNGASTGEVILSLNNRREPFNDKRVRQAVAYALDRQEIIDVAQFGFGVPVGSHMSPVNENYVDTTWRYHQDQDKARELLAEAGFPNGLDVVMTIPSTFSYATSTAQVVQQMMAEVGIRAEIELVDFPGQWLEEVFFDPWDYQISIIAHVEEFDIEIYARDDYYFGYDNPVFKDALNRARTEPDPVERQQLYAIAQFLIAEDVATFPMYELSNALILSNKVQNFWEDAPIPAADVSEVWLTP